MTISGVSSACPICTMDFENAEIVVKEAFTFEEAQATKEDDLTLIQTKCHHVFHNSCLMRWIKEFVKKTETPTCPTCRTVLINTPAITVKPKTPPHVQLQSLIAVLLANLDLLPFLADEADVILDAQLEGNFGATSSSDDDHTLASTFLNPYHMHGVDTPLPSSYSFRASRLLPSSLCSSDYPQLQNLGNDIFFSPSLPNLGQSSTIDEQDTDRTDDSDAD